MRRTFVYATMALLVAVRSSVAAPSAESESLEYRVKAAFLFNFVKFVEWPANAGSAPWVIGVLGHDPFGDALEETVRGKAINGRAIEVRHFTSAGSVKDCNVLFISRAESEKLASHSVPAQAGVLIVGEAPGFLQDGGAINFYLEDNRVHFEIKPAAARAAGLRVSSQLLKLGRVL